MATDWMHSVTLATASCVSDMIAENRMFRER